MRDARSTPRTEASDAGRSPAGRTRRARDRHHHRNPTRATSSTGTHDQTEQGRATCHQRSTGARPHPKAGHQHQTGASTPRGGPTGQPRDKHTQAGRQPSAPPTARAPTPPTPPPSADRPDGAPRSRHRTSHPTPPRTPARQPATRSRPPPRRQKRTAQTPAPATGKRRRQAQTPRHAATRAPPRARKNHGKPPENENRTDKKPP